MAFPTPPLDSSILAYNPFFPNGVISGDWAAYFTALQNTLISGPVTSFNGRFGVVSPTSGDYSASQITFTPAGTGAVASNADAKLKQFPSLGDFGIVSDSVTDQTTAITTWFTLIGSGAKGTYFIPYGTVFNADTVINAMPVGVMLVDMSGVNGDYPGVAGPTELKSFRLLSKDTTANDTMFGAISGHNAALILNNTGAAGTSSALARYATLVYRNGAVTASYLQFSKDNTNLYYNLALVTQTDYSGTTRGSTVWQVNERGRSSVGGGSLSTYHFSVGACPYDATDVNTTFGVVNQQNASTAALSLQAKSTGGTTRTYRVICQPDPGYASFGESGQPDALRYLFADHSFHVNTGATFKVDSGGTLSAASGSTVLFNVAPTSSVNGSSVQYTLTRTGTSAGTVNLGANASGPGATDTFNVLDSALANILQATRTGAVFPGYVQTTTQAANDNSTKAATTAYVDRFVTAGSTPGNPTGTTSTTAVMMGLAGSITPAKSGKVLMVLSGQMANSTANDGATVQLRYGTGAAPANGVAVTGTQAGASQTHNSLVAADTSGFSIAFPVTGLTIATAYWVDAALNAVTGGTATITGISLALVEL